MPYHSCVVLLVISSFAHIAAANQESTLPAWSSIIDQSHKLMYAHDDAGASSLLEGYYRRCQSDDIQVGARNSVILYEWARIATTYPPARMAAMSIRDQGAVKLLAGDDIESPERRHELILNGLFIDIVSIDDCFGDSQNAINLFYRLDEQKPHLARYCFDGIRRELLETGHLETCIKYLGNPIEDVESLLKSYKSDIAFSKSFSPKPIDEDDEKRFLKKDIDFVLRAFTEANRPVECRKIGKIPELLQLFPDWTSHTESIIRKYQQ